MLEENFRRTLIVSRGDFSIFLTRPISLGLLLTALVLVIAVAIPSVRNKRDDTFVAED